MGELLAFTRGFSHPIQTTAFAMLPPVECEMLYRQGWPEGRRKMRQYVKDWMVFPDRPSETTFDQTYDVSGSEVDVGRFLEGEPECMLDFQPGLTRRRIDLGFNLAASASTPENVLFYRGYRFLALLHSLHAMGMQTDVTLYCCSYRQGFRSDIEIKVSPTWDDDTAIFLLCHPAILRSLCIAMLLKLPRVCWANNLGRLCGMPCDPEEAEGRVVFTSPATTVAHAQRWWDQAIQTKIVDAHLSGC